MTIDFDNREQLNEFAEIVAGKIAEDWNYFADEVAHSIIMNHRDKLADGVVDRLVAHAIVRRFNKE